MITPSGHKSIVRMRDNKKARWLKVQPLKRLHSWQQSKCGQKIANTHPNKHPTHPHTQTSELGDYKKLSQWVSSKIQSSVIKSQVE